MIWYWPDLGAFSPGFQDLLLMIHLPFAENLPSARLSATVLPGVLNTDRRPLFM
jgi:hypothetical protein